MRYLLACVLACALFYSTDAKATHSPLATAIYKAPRIYLPHSKPTTSPSAPKATSTGSTAGGSWGGFTNALYLTGASCLGAHIGQWIYIGVTQNRDRTDKEIDMVWVGCTWGLYGIEYHRKWDDGKRKPQRRKDFTDMRHNQIN